MDKRVIFQAAAVAAMTAFIAVVVMAVASFSAGISLQPGSIPLPAEDFVRPMNEYAGAALGFFGGDSLFILSYLLVFAGLYAVTAERARSFAMVGMGAGVLTALFDTAENAFLIIMAQSANAGTPVPAGAPQLPAITLLVYVLTNLKWMAAFATLYAFGLVFPRRAKVEWVIVVLSLLFPLVGVLGIANPVLITVRGLFFLAGMPVYAWYFWNESRC